MTRHSSSLKDVPDKQNLRGRPGQPGLWQRNDQMGTFVARPVTTMQVTSWQFAARKRVHLYPACRKNNCLQILIPLEELFHHHQSPTTIHNKELFQSLLQRLESRDGRPVPRGTLPAGKGGFPAPPRAVGRGGFPAPPRPVKMIKTAGKLRGKI